jgi:glycosyltransferase involved in cell wall biosynthesis
LVLEVSLSNSVIFAGRLDRNEMATLYRSADIMLNPSLADNMPNSVLEAWASGVPVVSTNVGGIPYLVKDGVNGTLVPPADPEAMAHACVALVANRDLWMQRVQAGLEEAQRYTWEYVQPVLTAAYQRAIECHAKFSKG